LGGGGRHKCGMYESEDKTVTHAYFLPNVTHAYFLLNELKLISIFKNYNKLN
jgi:hypothetical protein